MSSDPVLVVRDLSKTFKLYRHPFERLVELVSRRRRYVPFHAVRSVGFSLRRGESVGLLGVNGSGKSTLLQMLAGTTTPSSGEILLKGRIAALLQLGTGFIPELSGRKNAVLALRILGLGDAEARSRLDWIEDFSGLSGHMDKAIKFYSSGMYARLAFSVATAVTPDIVLVDEALSVGDLGFQKKAESFMRMELAASTKLVVNHDLTSIGRHCDRVLVMDSGSLIFDGNTSEGLTFFRNLRGQSGKSSSIEIRDVRVERKGLDRREVNAGDEVSISCAVRSLSEDPVGFIVGFGWRDPMGRPAFGNQEVVASVVGPGSELQFSMDYTWPSLLDGDYHLDLWATSSETGMPLAERESCTRVENRGMRTTLSEFPSVATVKASSANVSVSKECQE